MTFLLLLSVLLLSAQDRPFYGPAFEFSVTPSRPLLEQGGAVFLWLNLPSGSPADLQFALAGVPSSVVADAVSLSSGAGAIELRCSPDTPPGVYALEITALAGQNRQTQTLPLVISSRATHRPQ